MSMRGRGKRPFFFFHFFLYLHEFFFILVPMNQINLALTLTEASLVLSALRDAADAMNAPQLDAVIDTLQASYNAANEEEPFDGFRTDAEADGDALASAGYGTDEDYGSAYDDHYDMGE
jgi:hypothetical protein